MPSNTACGDPIIPTWNVQTFNTDYYYYNNSIGYTWPTQYINTNVATTSNTYFPYGAGGTYTIDKCKVYLNTGTRIAVGIGGDNVVTTITTSNITQPKPEPEVKIDGLSKSEIYLNFIKIQRDIPGIKLTLDQMKVAREMWSAELKAKSNINNEKKRLQVVVDFMDIE